jgi:membrane-bound lytic murein transglycosylase D
LQPAWWPTTSIRQLLQQRATAEELFYAIKAQDIDLANLDRALGNTAAKPGVEELNKFRTRRQEMEKSYDKYLATLHIYSPKMTERQRLVLRVARIFGECELDMPPDFEAEINRYIERWRSSGRLKDAIVTAQQNGYTETISRETARARSSPSVLLPCASGEQLQSLCGWTALRARASQKECGSSFPKRRQVQLASGSLVDQPRPDPADDRHNYQEGNESSSSLSSGPLWHGCAGLRISGDGLL